MEKISIIVPIYNVEKYLSRCIESLLNQTYRNLEIILVDDGSIDLSTEIMKEYCKKDERVKVFFQAGNMGVSAARNRGLDEATGEWIAFCDSDDWYLEDFAEKMIMCAKEKEADYIICNYQITSDNNPAISVDCIGAIKNNLTIKQTIACGPVTSCCHLFRKELFESSKARYPEGIGHSEELPVVPVLAKYANKIAVLDEPLYCYYQRTGEKSASNTTKNYEAEILESIKKMKESLGEQYNEEAGFHVIYNLFYGEILNLCKKGASSDYLLAKIKEYEMNYPNYQQNKYYSSFGKSKRIFMWLERRRIILGMRILAKVHSLLIH